MISEKGDFVDLAVVRAHCLKIMNPQLTLVQQSSENVFF